MKLVNKYNENFCVQEYYHLVSFFVLQEGGLGKLKIPLLSDITHKISKDYGVYLEDQGIALR